MCRACELSKAILDIELRAQENRKLLELRLAEYDLVAGQRTSLESLKAEVLMLFGKDLDSRQRIGLRKAEMISFLKSDMYQPHEGSVDPSKLH